MKKQMKILITGASSGIGQATALNLVRKGHQVMITARRRDKLQQIASETASVVGEFFVAELDVRKPESIQAFVEANREWLKSVDVLINNAGLAVGRESVEQIASQELRDMVDTNVLGLLEMTRLVLPFMIARRQGHIVNMGSIAAISPYAGGTVYCATKAAVHAVTEALRQDLAGTGVRVSTIAPGRVAETEFSNVRLRGDATGAQKLYEGYRTVTADDVAETIAWVIERPAHVNIQEIVIMSTDQPTATTVVPVKPL
jgi:3-hydroxy acid dehydrogenase/malonic semialdehyde reductase